MLSQSLRVMSNSQTPRSQHQTCSTLRFDCVCSYFQSHRTYQVIRYLHYQQDEELARQLVELGYRGSGEVLKREEFEARKQQAEASRLAQRNKTKYQLLTMCYCYRVGSPPRNCNPSQYFKATRSSRQRYKRSIPQSTSKPRGIKQKWEDDGNPASNILSWT